MEAHPVDAVYRANGIDFQTSEATLGEVVERLAALPLIAQPGRAWNYSVATDVLGHLVAVISGQRFEAFPAGTGAGPAGHDRHRVSRAGGQARAVRRELRARGGRRAGADRRSAEQHFRAAPRQIASGGGGLCSTAFDYLRFCRMMLNKGELDGVRLLGRKTVELMTSNHLGGDMADHGHAAVFRSRAIPASASGWGFR